MNIVLKNKNDLSPILFNNINDFILTYFHNSRINDYKFILYYQDNNSIIGFIGLYFIDNFLLLNQLCVHHNFRNKGIASNLLNFIFNHFNNVYFTLYIDKNKDNTNFLFNFYSKKGFKEINDELLNNSNLTYFKDFEFLMIKII